ncbi:hypothetical protein FACS189465_2170 [Clostridia bacterium]|nr:hypothetical protein FACS189465_2170 [Clostridia bacterium]
MTFEKVKILLTELFDVEEETITLETDLVEDLSVDSLDFIDLLSRIEDEFDVKIPDDFPIESIKTVGDIVKQIENFKEALIDYTSSDDFSGFSNLSDFN